MIESATAEAIRGSEVTQCLTVAVFYLGRWQAESVSKCWTLRTTFVVFIMLRFTVNMVFQMTIIRNYIFMFNCLRAPSHFACIACFHALGHTMLPQSFNSECTLHAPQHIKKNCTCTTFVSAGKHNIPSWVVMLYCIDKFRSMVYVPWGHLHYLFHVLVYASKGLLGCDCWITFM